MLVTSWMGALGGVVTGVVTGGAATVVVVVGLGDTGVSTVAVTPARFKSIPPFRPCARRIFTPWAVALAVSPTTEVVPPATEIVLCKGVPASRVNDFPGPTVTVWGATPGIASVTVTIAGLAVAVGAAVPFVSTAWALAAPTTIRARAVPLPYLSRSMVPPLAVAVEVMESFVEVTEELVLPRSIDTVCSAELSVPKTPLKIVLNGAPATGMDGSFPSIVPSAEATGLEGPTTVDSTPLKSTATFAVVPLDWADKLLVSVDTPAEPHATPSVRIGTGDDGVAHACGLVTSWPAVVALAVWLPVRIGSRMPEPSAAALGVVARSALVAPPTSWVPASDSLRAVPDAAPFQLVGAAEAVPDDITSGPRAMRPAPATAGIAAKMVRRAEVCLEPLGEWR